MLKPAYAEIRSKEQAIDVDHLDPSPRSARIAELTFDHHEAHPDFIRLVAIENIHRAEHLAELPDLRELGSPAIELIDAILTRGREAGTFTRDVDALDVHMVISSFCVFRIANRHTFGDAVRPRPRGRGPPRPLPPDARRPGRRLPHRSHPPPRSFDLRDGAFLLLCRLTY